MGIYGKKEDASKVLTSAIPRKHSTEICFDNIFSEYVANFWENVDNRIHFQVTCFQSTPWQKVHPTRNILIKFFRNFVTHAYSSEQKSNAS